MEYNADLTALAETMQPEADGSVFLYWDKIHDGVTRVTENMVISAVYETATYTVNFYSSDGPDKELIATRQVEYGKAAELPETDPTYEDRQFLGWSTAVKWWSVRSDMDVYPILVYNETTSDPIAPGGTHQVGMGDEITLTAAENAKIYYTTDGSDPVPGEEGTFLYTGPIPVTDESVTIRAIAVEDSKNSSEVVDVYFDYATGLDHEYSDGFKMIQRSAPLVRGGDQLTMNLKIHNNPGLVGYLFFVECDPSVYYMEYDPDTGYSYAAGDVTEDGMYFVHPVENGFRVMWFNTAPAEGDGTLFTLNLKVANGVAFESYPITISYSAENMITNEDVEFDELDAEFDLETPGASVVGDVDGDGALSLADVILIAKFKAGLYPITEPAKLRAADANSDGNVNLADAVRLAQFLIGLVEEL